MDYQEQGAHLRSLLELRLQPVALAFRAEPPPAVRRITGPAPAGCGYWRMAAEGSVFFTEASDHYQCPIGAYTHGVPLPDEGGRELDGLLEAMARIQYIRIDEVPAIPRRSPAFKVAVYAPLTASPVTPDVVIVRGNGRQMMILAEAVHAAGVAHDPAAQLRPTCAIVPTATEAGRASLSLGCIGNRVYTGLGDDEMYFAIPGDGLSAVVEKLATIVSANRTLEAFHRQRQDQITLGL